MNGPADHARGWLRKARSDLDGARRLLDGSGPYDLVCFHAQQAIEKSLKAVLDIHGSPVERTHDLKRLAIQVRELVPGLDLDAEALSEITPFAVDLRYDSDFWPERDVAADAVEKAEELHRRVLEAMPEEARP